MTNKYYEEIQEKLKELVQDEKYEQALSIINDELSMPYIPMEFEAFLNETLKQIPMDDVVGMGMTFERILDIISKLSNDESLMIDISELLGKFNLNSEKEEMINFYNNIESKRVKALVYEEMIKQLFDHEFENGNPSKTSLISDDEQFISDVNELKDKLVQYESIIENAIVLLKDIYLVKYFGNEIREEQWDVVMFALSRIFKIEELVSFIPDMEKVKIKLETFNPIHNL